MRAESKYKGSLKLAAIGDALGWITEFEKSKHSLRNKYGVDYINKYYDWEKTVGGRFNGYTDKLYKGSYSDDTQLLLAVARSIKPDGSVDQGYFADKELPEWLLYSRGAGRTIKNAARKIERKSASWNKNFFSFKAGNATIDYRDSGANGAAMRILPIALANLGDPDKINEEIFGNSIITHGHPRAILGAMLYGYAIDTILRFRPENFNYKTFLTELGQNMHQKFSVEFLVKDKFISWEREWNSKSDVPFRELFSKVIDEAQNYLRLTYSLLLKNTSDSETLSRLGCFKNETKGSGISTTIAGIYLTCKYVDEPLKGIEQAVNAIGSDTDSIAAFTGGLTGALHSQSVIPGRWKGFQDSDYLDAMAIRMLEISEGRFKQPETVNCENLKSIKEIVSDDIELNQKVYLDTLGCGIVKSIERQNTLTKGKYNLIFDVQFDIGQFCRFSKLLTIKDKDYSFENIQPREEVPELFNVLKPDKNTMQRLNVLLKRLNENDRIELKEILKQIEKNIR